MSLSISWPPYNATRPTRQAGVVRPAYDGPNRQTRGAWSNTMSETDQLEVGTICWTDLTIDDADGVRDFYQDVVGWKVDAVDMGGYSDYTMCAPDSGKGIAGICHARDANKGLPAQWLVYIQVRDADASAERCVQRGGKVLVAPKDMGSYGRYCVIQDPAGAVAALIAPPE